MDLAGLALIVAAIGWTFCAAALSGGDAGPTAALFAVCALTFGVARFAGALGQPLIPISVVISAGALLLVSPGDVLSSAPLSGPFGYANAKGAFFVQAAIAGLMLTVMSQRRAMKGIGLLAAGAFALVPIASGSATAAVLVVLLPLGGLAIRARLGTRVAVGGMAGALAVVVASTTIVATTMSGGQSQSLGSAALSARRIELWHEAVWIMKRNPGAGVGPGRFRLTSRSARADQDARWAHHEFLQFGAETGVPGLLLMVLAFVWGFTRLAMSGSGKVIVLGAAALGALGIHASVDYILHFPAVPVLAAAIVGTAVGSTGERRQGANGRWQRS